MTAESSRNFKIILKSIFREHMRGRLINVGWISIDDSGSSEKRQNSANEGCARKLAALVGHNRKFTQSDQRSHVCVYRENRRMAS